jgi:hypothetical protein
MQALLLKRNFYTTLNYDELKTRLKRRVGTNFKLGVVDNEEISLYYLKDWYTEHGMDRVPFCQMGVKNKTDADGRIRVTFGIATFVMIAIALFPVILVPIFHFTNPQIPFYYLFGLYPVCYLFLQVAVGDQADKFELDLRQLETEEY